jgi:3-oxoacyl-[acyl-carrier protein] reductase
MSSASTQPTLPRSLAGRVVVVTTAGDGFSQAIARGLADAGATIALVGAPATRCPAVSAITATGGSAAAIPCDLDSPESTASGFLTAADALGSIDIVVHARVESAALAPLPLAALDLVGWDRCCEAEIRCALNVFRAAWSALRERGGRLFLVTPTLSHAGAVQHAAYAAACEAIRALAKSAARRWGTAGIHVNCLAPDLSTLAGSTAGGESAQDTALGRHPDVRADIAPLIAALAGDGGRFVTGETIRIDGGRWFA